MKEDYYIKTMIKDLTLWGEDRILGPRAAILDFAGGVVWLEEK